MSLLTNIYHNNKEVLVKTINRFTLTTCILTVITSVLYFVLEMYQLALFTAIIGVLYFAVFILNKKSFHSLARVMAIVVSNIGVILFSSYLGFNSGIYLYLFASPQLIYLLFRGDQKINIYFTLGFTLSTFLVVYAIEHFNLINHSVDNESVVQLIYGINFVFSMIFGIVLVAIFAKNNDTFIELLKESNTSLENQKENLKIEIKSKNIINKQLEKSIKEKEVLLSEVHHRVKNNLAVISGLLELQNIYVKDKVVSDILTDSKNRIKTIALLHEKLYQHHDLDKIDFQKYIAELIGFIKLSYSKSSNSIQIRQEVEQLDFSMESALPFSLFIHELITNSFKHAFEGKENGEITIKLGKKDTGYIFQYTDNGIGFDPEKAADKNSIGINLINAFTEQLDGELIDKTQLGKGCDITLTFKTL